MRVLITGANGFIAKWLIKSLLGKAEIFTTSRNILETSDYKDFFQYYVDEPWYYGFVAKEVKPTHIIHLAGPSHHSYDTTEFVEGMVNPLVNLLDAAPPGCRFIYASSSSVYSLKNSGGTCYEYDAVSPETNYGATKLYCENLINVATKAGKIQGVNLRLCAVVGGNPSHGLFKEIMDTLYKTDDSIELWGREPGAVMPYIHVDDVVSAIEIFMGNTCTGAFNVANSTSWSKKQLVDFIFEFAGKRRQVEWIEHNLSKNEPELWININKLGLTDWRPKHYGVYAIKQAVEDWKSCNLPVTCL